MARWSHNSKQCKNCGTSWRKHIANGFCVKCYPISNRMETVKKWDMNNPKTLKAYSIASSVHDSKTFVILKNGVSKQLKQRLDWLRIREEKLKGPIDGLELEYAFGCLAHQAGVKKNIFHGLDGWFEMEFDGKQRLAIFTIIDKIQQNIPEKGINWYPTFPAS